MTASTVRPSPGGRGTLVHLCFHGVGEPERELEPGEAAYWVDEQAFLDILDEVAGDPRVRLSFDDGNRSDLTVALPALAERGLHATFFVLAGRLDRAGSLSSQDVRTLAGRGMRIGSHGMDHVSWRGLGREGAWREMVEARALLSGILGHTVEVAALPLGRYDREVLTRLRRLGYRGVYSSDRGLTTDRRWLQPRSSLLTGDSGDSVRRRVLADAGPARRLRAQAVGTVKRWR